MRTLFCTLPDSYDRLCRSYCMVAPVEVAAVYPHPHALSYSKMAVTTEIVH